MVMTKPFRAIILRIVCCVKACAKISIFATGVTLHSTPGKIQRRHHESFQRFSTNRLWLCMLLLACFLLPINIAKAALTASVDRTAISKNDTIELTIRSDQGPLQPTDFNELDKHFTVINNRSSNQVSITNGQRKAAYDLIFILLPKGEGTLTIPEFKSRGESSQAIKIEVSTGSLNSQQPRQEIFFDNEVSKQEIYVQEQLLYTLRLFLSVGVSETQITPFNVENAVIEIIGDQKEYQTVINGIRYSVFEKQYAIFPEKSGQLILPEQVFIGRPISSRNSYNSRTNRSSVLSANGYIKTQSASYSIKVLPKPANYPASEVWLPTPELHINDSWNDKLPTFTVGEPATRTLTLFAKNLTAAQLPNLKLPASTQLKMYPDQSKDEDRTIANGLMGQRSFSTVIVPSIAGTVEVPAIEVTWWNTDSKQLEVTIVPAKTLTVLPAATTSNAAQPFKTPLNTAPAQNITPPQIIQTSSGVWPWLSFLFALLWFGTAFMWWQSKQYSNTKNSSEFEPSQSHQNARAAYKALKKACLENDAKNARQTLINWFRLSHKEQHIQQLKDITQLYQDEELARLIRELESLLYSNAQAADSWQGIALWGAIERLEKNNRQQSSKDSTNNRLKPLYPF